jgi:hypothetical protein
MRAFDDEVALTVAQLYLVHMLQRTLPSGFIAPCLPTKTDKLPSGSQWLHEIKHDGFRVIARKTGAQVRLYSRPGNDLTRRFPLIVETLAGLRWPPALSMAKLSPAMTTALPRSISSVTTGPTSVSSSMPSISSNSMATTCGSRSRSPGLRHQWSDTSKSACLMGYFVPDVP